MESFTRLLGIGAPLLRDNIDTDAIIPSRETRSLSREGYGEKLFANWRYRPGTREENPDFVLNREPFRQAVILLVGRNFGCGSSREAAVWSLAQFGIRCVVAPSFGEIFRGNCVRNGVLPALVPSPLIEELSLGIERDALDARLSVDLAAQIIETRRGHRVPFEIAPLDRKMLLEGKEEIELTLDARSEILAFEARDRERRPWIHS